MKLLSVRQYAALVEISPQAVKKQIDKGKLPAGVIAEKVDTYWVIMIPTQK